MHAVIQQHPMVVASQRLGGDRVYRQPALANVATRLCAEVQMGAAHHDGELVLAAREYDFPSNGRAQGSHAVLFFTDRRVFGSLKASNIDATLIDVPLGAITHVTEDRGLLNNAVVLTTAQGTIRIPIWGKELAPYFQAVMGVPPPHRTLGPFSIAPAQGDPIGAHTATSLMVSGNPVVATIPLLAFEAGRRGQLSSEAARALCERAVIADRTVAAGRGMHQGYWLSTLPRPHLSSLLSAMFSPPIASMGDATWERHDFSITPGGRSAGAAAASSAIGLASAAILGVGWVSRPGGGLGFSTLRATLTDLPCGTGVMLAAAQGAHTFRLPFAASGLLDALFTTLTRIELRRLLAEAAMGHGTPPEQLGSVPREALEAAVASLGAPLSLAPLYPK